MLDPALTFQLDLLRVDAHLRAQIIAILEEMERELIARVAAGVSDWSKARIAQQLSEAAAIIRQYYDTAAGVAIDTTTGVYQVAATDTARTLAVVVGADLAPVLPPLAQMEALARNTITQGATQAAWWRRQAGDAEWRFGTAVRQGLVAAETNGQIIRRVRAELDVTRANAAALVQTSVQTVANEARWAVMSESKAVTGVQYVATLDTHTCPVCAPRDGMRWGKDRTAQDGALPFRNPPLHFNCRCVLIPRTRFSDMGNPQRASSEGPISAKTTFTDYLDRKGKAFQDDVLGPGRADLYRAGKITLQDLVTRSGRTLTLVELRAKYG